jgi:hypothetical protein
MIRNQKLAIGEYKRELFLPYSKERLENSAQEARVIRNQSAAYFYYAHPSLTAALTCHHTLNSN